MALAN